MTKEQIRIEAEAYNKSLKRHPSSEQALTEVLVGFYERLQKLQQTPCYTALELLEQMLKDLQKLNAAGYEDFKDLMKGSENERALQRVIRLIGERQANAV